MAPDKPGLHNGNFVTKLVLIVKIQLKKKEYNISHLCQVNMVNKQLVKVLKTERDGRVSRM